MNPRQRILGLCSVGLLIICIALTIQPAGAKPLPCHVTCMRGSRCFEEKCIPCPDGYFQDESGHQHTQCKPWTHKPNYLNFVIKTPGTRTHDVEWTCKEGHELFRYTPGEYECRKIVTTSPRTSPSTTANTLHETTEKNMQVKHARYLESLELAEQSAHLEPLEKTINHNPRLIVAHILITVSVLLLLFIIGVNTVFRRFLEKKFHSNKHYRPTFMSCHRKKKKEKTPDFKVNFESFSSVIYQLGEDSYMFINHLKDPSKTFIADSSLYFYRNKCESSKDAYAKAFLEWTKKNKKDPNIKQYIVKALRDVGRADVIAKHQLTSEIPESSTYLLTCEI